MKSNSCGIHFYCDTNEDCVYATKKPNGQCKYFYQNYYDYEICTSKVAQVNSLTLELKELIESEKGE